MYLDLQGGTAAIMELFNFVLLRPYKFSKKLQPKLNITEIGKMVLGARPVIQIVQFWRCLFFINSNIFLHLKLEIALAIPASNKEK